MNLYYGFTVPCPFLKAFSLQFQKSVEKLVLFGSWVTQYCRKQHLHSFSFFQTSCENGLIVEIVVVQMCCLRGDELCLMKKFISLILVGTEYSSQQTDFLHCRTRLCSLKSWVLCRLGVIFFFSTTGLLQVQREIPKFYLNAFSRVK